MVKWTPFLLATSAAILLVTTKSAEAAMARRAYTLEDVVPMPDEHDQAMGMVVTTTAASLQSLHQNFAKRDLVDDFFLTDVSDYDQGEEEEEEQEYHMLEQQDEAAEETNTNGETNELENSSPEGVELPLNLESGDHAMLSTENEGEGEGEGETTPEAGDATQQSEQGSEEVGDASDDDLNLEGGVNMNFGDWTNPGNTGGASNGGFVTVEPELSDADETADDDLDLSEGDASQEQETEEQGQTEQGDASQEQEEEQQEEETEEGDESLEEQGQTEGDESSEEQGETEGEESSEEQGQAEQGETEGEESSEEQGQTEQGDASQEETEEGDESLEEQGQAEGDETFEEDDETFEEDDETFEEDDETTEEGEESAEQGEQTEEGDEHEDDDLTYEDDDYTGEQQEGEEGDDLSWDDDYEGSEETESSGLYKRAPSKLTKEQQKILDIHNTYRARHKAPPLVWNAKAAAFGAKHIKACQFRHSSGPYGENLAIGYSGFPHSIQAWYGEEKLYNYNRPGFAGETGHFTQVVWRSTKSVGCARRYCSNHRANLYICNYDAPGNIVGDNNAYFRKNVLPKRRLK